MRILFLAILLKLCLGVERALKVPLNSLSSEPRMQFINKFDVNVGEEDIQIRFYKFDNTDLFQN